MRCLNNEKGFTLIELIVSLAILLIVIVPLSGYFLVSVDNNQDAKRTQDANMLAQSEMERWKQSGIVGDLSPADVVSGDYVIRKRAVLENRSSNPIAASGSEPIAPTIPRKPDDPLYSVSPPVTSGIEDYVYPEDSQSSVDATLHLYDDGIIMDNDTKDTGLFTTMDLSVANGNAILDLGSISKSMTLTNGHLNALDLVIDIQTDTPTRTLNALNGNILQDAYIYIYRGNKPSGGYYSEGAIQILPETEKVKVYHNLTTAPAGTDDNRLYRVSVEIYRTGDLTRPLAKLDSMMKTK